MVPRAAGAPARVASPYWRSTLSVPASSRRFLERAHTRGADAILLDLEDGVAPAERPSARRRLPEAIEQVGRGPADILVRVNQPWELMKLDLDAAVHPDVTAIDLPKVDRADEVRRVSDHVATLAEARGLSGPPALELTIETPITAAELEDVCAASTLTVAVDLGVEDLSQVLRVAPDSEVLLPVHSGVVLAARRAGLLPLGLVGSLANFRDEAGFREICRRSRRFGYIGGTAIHPVQVPILNREFAPSTEEVDEAREVVALFERALAEGHGAVQRHGSMIDEPVARRARALLELADLLEAEQRRRETRVRVMSGQRPQT